MWKREYRLSVSDISAEQVWAVWSNIQQWPRYDKGLEWVKASEGFTFTPGQAFYLKPVGGPKVKIILTEVTPNKIFVDYTAFFGARMYDHHELLQTQDGLCVKNTISVTGPLAWLWRKLVAEKVAAGLAEQMQSLIALARQS